MFESPSWQSPPVKDALAYGLAVAVNPLCVQGYDVKVNEDRCSAPAYMLMVLMGSEPSQYTTYKDAPSAPGVVGRDEGTEIV